MYLVEFSCGCQEEGSGTWVLPRQCPMHGAGTVRSTISMLSAFVLAHAYGISSQNLGRPRFTPNIEGMRTWRNGQ